MRAKASRRGAKRRTTCASSENVYVHVARITNKEPCNSIGCIGSHSGLYSNPLFLRTMQVFCRVWGTGTVEFELLPTMKALGLYGLGYGLGLLGFGVWVYSWGSGFRVSGFRVPGHASQTLRGFSPGTSARARGGLTMLPALAIGSTLDVSGHRDCSNIGTSILRTKCSTSQGDVLIRGVIYTVSKSLFQCGGRNTSNKVLGTL